MELKPTPLNFWSDVWNEGIIRFHQKDYNPHMVRFFQDIDLTNQTVFIPLAGKTNDILFFLEKGAHVFALEFVEAAVVDFFKENKIPFIKKDQEYHAENLTFIVMDFFDYYPKKPFDVIYDRASQVVFSEEDRPKYYDHMKNFLSKDTTLLLLSIDHEGPKDYGPPFKISSNEIISSYEKFGISLKVISKDLVDASEKMQAQGILRFENLVLARN